MFEIRRNSNFLGKHEKKTIMINVNMFLFFNTYYGKYPKY